MLVYEACNLHLDGAFPSQFFPLRPRSPPSLTRPQQADFLRKTFASYHVTERQLAEIYQAVPVPTGRPRKPDK
jgi:hypothetical protein